MLWIKRIFFLLCIPLSLFKILSGSVSIFPHGIHKRALTCYTGVRSTVTQGRSSHPRMLSVWHSHPDTAYLIKNRKFSYKEGKFQWRFFFNPVLSHITLFLKWYPVADWHRVPVTTKTEQSSPTLCSGSPHYSIAFGMVFFFKIYQNRVGHLWSLMSQPTKLWVHSKSKPEGWTPTWL